MKIRFRNRSLTLGLCIIVTCLACETWTLGITDKTVTTLGSYGHGGSFIVSFTILQLSALLLVVKCSPSSTSMGIRSISSHKKDQPIISSRSPRFIKELTMMNRQSCLSKILCGVEVSQPPTSSTSTINDYAYLVKSFFDKLSIQGAVKTALDVDDDATEDDISSDPSDLNEFKSNFKRPYTSYSDVMESFHDEELDQMDRMPLEYLLGESRMLLDFKRRRSKMVPQNLSGTVKGRIHNLTEPFRFQSDRRGYLGYSNPRFDKTSFLNKKQLELGQTNTENEQLKIAAEIATKMRSPRQCRLLGWLRPSYTTTTTITTTSNMPAPAAGVSSSTCPFTVPELQKMIIGSQVTTPATPMLANINLKAPAVRPIKNVLPMGVPITTTTKAPKESFAGYFDNNRNVGPQRVIPELDGVYRPKSNPNPLSYQFRPKITLKPHNLPVQPKNTKRLQPKPHTFSQRLQYQPNPPILPQRFKPRPNPKSRLQKYSKRPKLRTTPAHNFGLLSFKPTPNPKLSWTTTTQRPWAELAFGDHLPQYAYKKPLRLSSGLDYEMDDDNSKETSGEDNSEEIQGSKRPSASGSVEDDGYSDDDKPKYGNYNNNDIHNKFMSAGKKEGKENSRYQPQVQKSVEESEESDEVPKLDEIEDESNRVEIPSLNQENNDGVDNMKSSEESNDPDSQKSFEESQESDEGEEPQLEPNLPKSKPIRKNHKIHQEKQLNKTETFTTDSSTTQPLSLLPSSSGMLSNLLSDHGRRTLSRISSLFNYGSKPEIQPPHSPPTKPHTLPKKSIRNRKKDKPQYDIDGKDKINGKKRLSRHPVHQPPSITPIFIEDGESWENDNSDEEEFSEKIKTPKTTTKPEKYDYDDDNLSNESKSSETTNTHEGVDFGPGQKIHTEYSDVVSSFLKPGDRFVGQDRYISGLPSSWESIYEEAKNNNKNKESSESDEVNTYQDGNSDESEEDDEDLSRRRPPYPPPPPID